MGLEVYFKDFISDFYLYEAWFLKSNFKGGGMNTI